MVFIAIAAVMVAAALAAVLVPLVHLGRRSGSPRAVFALALVVAFGLPLASVLLYLQVGAPIALNGVPQQDQAPQTLEQAIAALRAHLAQQPDDVQGWKLLVQVSTEQHDPLTARDALDHVLKLAPNDAEAMVSWAENDALTRADHKITGHAVDLLKHAVQLQPDSQRGLWLLGIAQFQHGDYADAAATWRVLQPQLQAGSKVAIAVADQIAQADRRAGVTPAPAAPGQPAVAASLKVHVSLAPALAGKLAAGDVLFVYARAPDGPPMPLAVTRLDAGRLPTTVILDDAMAMSPARKLSSVSKVFVGARISHSGDPMAQPGDLEGDAGVVALGRDKPVTIRIDKVH